MSKLSEVLDSAVILGGMTTIYIEIAGDFKNVTVTAAGIATLLIAVIRVAIIWREWRHGRKRQNPPNL